MDMSVSPLKPSLCTQTSERYAIPTMEIGTGRQKGESAKAFEAFSAYRDMGGTRSYAKVAEKLGKSVTLISRWGTKWGWQNRLHSHIEFLESERLESQRKAVQEMNDRHVATALQFQQKVLRLLEALDVNRVSTRDLARWFEISVAVERSARGLTVGTKLAVVEQFESPEMMRPETNEVNEAVKRLSMVDRELLRRLCLKKLKILALEAELEVENSVPALPDRAS